MNSDGELAMRCGRFYRGAMRYDRWPCDGADAMTIGYDLKGTIRATALHHGVPLQRCHGVATIRNMPLRPTQI